MQKKVFIVLAVVILTALLFAGCTEETEIAEGETAIQSSGEAVVTQSEKEEKPERLYPAYVLSGNSSKYGYINNEGVFVIKPAYDYAMPFDENGHASVSINEDEYKSYTIDLKGNIIDDEKKKYDYIFNYSEGMATAEIGNKYVVIDEDDKILFKSDYYVGEYHEGLAYYQDKTDSGEPVYGYMDNKGNIVIKAEYSKAFDFMDGKAVVQTGSGGYRLIDKSGNVIKVLPYKRIGFASEGLMTYSYEEGYGGKTGYIDTNGDIVIRAEFYDPSGFKNGLAVVNTAESFSDGKYGVINKKGEFVIQPLYSYIYELDEGFYAACESAYDFSMAMYEKKAIFNADGKRITDFLYYRIEGFNNGTASVCDGKKTWFIDANGYKLDSLPEFEGAGYARVLDEDVVEAHIDDELIYAKKDGKVFWRAFSKLVTPKGVEIEYKKYRPDIGMLIYFPEFKNLKDKKLMEEINGKLRQYIVGNDPTSEMEDGMLMSDITKKFYILENNNVISLNVEGYWYPIGAAHGTPYSEYLHIDINTGEFYALEDMFIKGSSYIERITEEVNHQIFENSENYFVDRIDSINPDQEFRLDEDGIELIFQVYEIAPYAGGQPSFKITYDSLADIIDIESSFWQAIGSDFFSGQNAVLEIDSLMGSYLNKLVEAINTGSFAVVEKYLLKDSNLYNSQRKLVENLYGKGIKERVVNYSVDSVEEVDKYKLKIYVTEEITIIKQNGEEETNTYYWMYTAEKINKENNYAFSYKLSDIQKPE
ncbi:MAG: WG repeat-containing protein [Bacillota bacterium]